MDAALTAEQIEIRRTVREALLKHCATDDVRAAAQTRAGYDEALWRQLADRPGLAGLAVEGRYGGAGCGPTELALVCEETGQALLPSPLLATAAVTAPLVAALGSEEQRAVFLPRLASGELTGALVVPCGTLPEAFGLTGREDGGWSGGGRAGGVQARRDGDGWRLYGEAAQVLDGHSAGLLLVAAHTGGYARGRTLLFAVRPEGASGVARRRLTVLDETRPQARVQLRDVPAEPLGDAGRDVRAAMARLGGVPAAVLAAEAVGVAGRALEQTVQYARVREQFGRPIGSFQAVKHRLADLYVAVQAARSAAYYAAWAAGNGPSAAIGGLALAQALEAARLVTGEAVQLHGGVGVTWDHDVQLYFKRAASDELLFGPVQRLREHAAQAAGLFAAAMRRETVVL
ncbi:alkylation response protein AidB-like acyl-CoA dehydrogenase [Streptomyces olivoverticillatus]|uniref:Alkylation response protein AidB-like acyl-CoA dehydrogenase n=1 Tax=Streptomyces olivoverticillatus TaxID=66427 RepID=A0A7W7PLU5_9ACTN|nr:acyl-CoA dehydrogenase family protein [Streptomyces olivoverticillatus]MBB4894632.1 alkylation response protein AidB-like acyl-CoA dehydrogenase [Streptomyces olivoverticillatus]